MPELSVIVPVYNKEQYIDDCVNSILNQTFKSLELILVNDGSTDGSYEKCLRFKARDSRVTVIDQKNAGVSAARNAGLEIVRGAFIGFIDADDTIDPDMYHVLLNTAKQHDADICSCRIRVVYPNKVEQPAESSDVNVLTKDEALCLFFKRELEESANNKIFKSNKVGNIRFEGRVNEDILYNCKAILAVDKVVSVNKIKYNYLIRENSISMEGFSLKYMETLDISAKMLELVKDRSNECIQQAMVFDLVANISILNLILLSGKNNYPAHYQQIVKRLNGYKPFIKSSASVRKKHKVAFAFFAISPKLYTWFLYAYGKIAKADIIHRTSAPQQKQKVAS